jgi:hypothetical protein
VVETATEKPAHDAPPSAGEAPASASARGTGAGGSGTGGSGVGSPGGRLAGVIVYWLLIAFVIGFAVRSITQRVFWPPAAATAPAATCRDGLTLLADELHAFAGRAAGSPSTPPDADAFFAAWDLRYHALSPRCDTDAARAAHGTLARYRFSLEQSLVRHRREETELSRDFDARLDALRP